MNYRGMRFTPLRIRLVTDGAGAPATYAIMRQYCAAIKVRGLKDWPLELIN